MLNITKTQIHIIFEKIRKLLLQRAQKKRSNREGNKKESQQLTWMRLIKSPPKKIKAKRVIYHTGTLLV